MEPLRKQLGKDYLLSLDDNLRFLCRMIKKELYDENDMVIAITGYPGVGKSNDAAIIGCLIDPNYTFENICFIPTSKEIEKMYMGLPMHSVFHIDEASRGLHKHKWYDKIQQKLNELYDTEREGHYLCTILLMPRFQNFTENFRNFRIKYWINVISRGLAVCYKRDEDKDCKDPWHIDENYKKKLQYWKSKKIFERSVGDIISVEQRTANYLFYFKIPQIPQDIWNTYQELKAKSRTESKEKEAEAEVETYHQQLKRQREDRFNKIRELRKQGKNANEIAALLDVSVETIRKNMHVIAYKDSKGSLDKTSVKSSDNLEVSEDTYNNIYNKVYNDKKNEKEELSSKEQKATPPEDKTDQDQPIINKLDEGDPDWLTNGLNKTS